MISAATMFRVFIRLIILALVAVGTPGSRAGQTPEAVVEQNVKAQGGAKTLSRIQTVAIEGNFTRTSDGKTGTYTFNTRSSNRYYSEIVSGGQVLIEAYNGKSAWHQTPNGEVGTMVGPEGAQLEAAGQYYNFAFANAKKNNIGVAFVGHAPVRGKDALQIELRFPSGVKRQAFFDVQTHWIVEESATVAGIDEQIFYGDYRRTGPLHLPYKIELHRANDVYDITVTRAAVNGTIGERVFDFPKTSQVQLPDLKALFKEIDDNQKAIDKIKENYAGTHSDEETEYDKSGKVTTHKVESYTFFYLSGEEVSTLVSKDGKPLGEEEQKKENEKTQKRIQELEKRESKKEAKEEKSKEQGKSGSQNDEDVGIEPFLRAVQFVNPRRERFLGQDVLVFDFEPNPDFKAHSLPEKVVQKLAGVIWIDEKAHDVARLEAYFVGDFKFAGGVLANLQKGTSFVFEQSFINNEVWLPTYEEAHVGVRVLLVKGFKVNQVTRYSDYKKFNVESIIKTDQPKGASTPAANPSDATSPPNQP
jgi:hypothetical protein